MDYSLLSPLQSAHVAVGSPAKIEVQKCKGQRHGDALATASNREVNQEGIGEYYEAHEDGSVLVIVFFPGWDHFKKEEACNGVKDGEKPFSEILIESVGGRHDPSEDRTVAVGMSFVGTIEERGIKINFVVEVGEDIVLAFEVVIVFGESFDDVNSEGEPE